MDYTQADLENMVVDLQTQIDKLQIYVSRLQNLQQVGTGSSMPVSTVSGIDVPPVSRLAVTTDTAILGQTKLIVSWIDPPDTTNIDRYNIFVQGNVTGQTQPVQVSSAQTSPAVFNILPDQDIRSKLLVQTVLKNGQVLGLENCPTTAFVFNSPMKVGIGTDDPKYTLHIVTPNSQSGFVFSVLDQHSTNDGGSSEYKFFKTRGSPASIAVVQSGDSLGSVGFSGYDNFVGDPTAARDGAQVLARTTQNWTSSAHGTRLTLRTTPNNTIFENDVVDISQDANLGLMTTNYGGGSVVFAMANCFAVPNTNPTGGVLYVDGGALKYRGSSGTVTPIAPA